MADGYLDAYVKRAKDNYDRLTADPANLAHADQGAAMWKRAFEEHGLALDPVTARVVIFALGLTGGRATNYLDNGDVAEYACTEASTYLVPALGDSISLDELPELEADDGVVFAIEIDPHRLVRQARNVGALVYAVTGAVLLWRRFRG